MRVYYVAGVVGDVKSVHIVDFKLAADHPFLFFIVDEINLLPLFSGWVVAP